MNSSLFFNVSITDINFKVLSALNEDLIAEFTLNDSKTIFLYPFDSVLLEIKPSDLNSFKLKIKTKYKELGHCYIKINEESNEFLTHCVLFSEKEGIKAKAVTGTLTLKMVKSGLSLFEDDKVHEEIFTFKREVFNEILKFLDRGEKGNDFQKLGLSLDLSESSLKRKFKKIKCLLNGVNEKLKVLDVFKEQKIRQSEDIKNKDRRIEELLQDMEKNLKYFEGVKEDYEKIIKNKDKKIIEQADLIGSLEKNARDALSENFRLKTEIELIAARNSENSDQSKLVGNAEKMIQELKITLAVKEKASEKYHTEIEELKNHYKATLSSYEDTLASLMESNESLSSQNQILRDSQSSLQSSFDLLSTEVLSLKSSQLYLSSLHNVISNLEEQLSQSESSLKFYKEESLSLKDQLENHNKRFSDVCKELQKEKLHIHKSVKILTSEVSDLKGQIQVKDKENSNLLVIISEYKSRPFVERDYVSIEKLANRSLDNLKIVSSSYEKYENEYSSQLNNLVGFYFNLSFRYLSLQRTVRKIVNFYKEKSGEITMLREMIAEFKSRQLYMPVNGDIIDNYLANYINSRLEKLEVPFVRLYHGMYLFGSKKISMKIENSGIVIRLGGGFSNIEDFIKNYTEPELEKIGEAKEERIKNSSPATDEGETRLSRKFDRSLTMMLGNSSKGSRKSMLITSDKKIYKKDSMY